MNAGGRRPAEGCGQWWLYALALLAGAFALRPIWDVDIFWHIAAGRWIIEHGGFPTTDIFTFVEPPRDWVTFQWGYEVICAAVESAWGLAGIRVFHALVTAGAMVSFVHLALGWSESRLANRSLAVGLAALALAVLVTLYADRVRARPHVFNLLFWSLALDLLLVARVAPWRRNALLALLVLFWANLHAGGAFIFLVVLGAWPAGSLLIRWLPNSGRTSVSGSPRQAFALFGSALLPAVLSPNWGRGVWQAYSMLGGSEAFIEEWLPFWHYFAVASHGLHWLCGSAALAGLALVVVSLRRSDKLPLEPLLVALGATLLPFRSARFVYLVAFAVVLLLPDLLRHLSRAPIRIRTVTFLLPILLVITTLDYHVRAQFGTPLAYVTALSSDLDERRFPVEFDGVIAKLASHRTEPLKVFCQPNWGGYLLYRHYPAIRVIADGRGNVSKDLGQRLHFIYKFRHDVAYQRAVADIYDRSGADALVMQNPVAGDTQALEQWAPVAASGKGMVLLRK